MPKPVSLIVACAANRVIGRDGRLPFDIPEDKAWFREKTAGNVVVLGRVCFESWPRVLSDRRRPVVISSQPDRIRAHAARLRDAPKKTAQSTSATSAPADPPLVEPAIAASVPEALALAQKIPGGILVCGGQRVYEEALPGADRLLLTLVHADVRGDTWFPEWRHLSWRETWRREGADANWRYTFSILERVR